MSKVIPVFIGYDPTEEVAYHTLAHSIIRNSSKPVSITPVRLSHMSEYTRPRGDKDSTEFSISRFMVPWMCDFTGHAIFMDCDMMVTGDIAELWELRDHKHAVQVVKHDYVPIEKTKMLGQEQTKYKYKNWTSVMIFNNAKCHKLMPDYIKSANGLDLHQFKWVQEGHTIGELPHEWNHLVGVDAPRKDAKLVHWTLGGPWWNQYLDVEYADEWVRELRMLNYSEQLPEIEKERVF